MTRDFWEAVLCILISQVRGCGTFFPKKAASENVMTTSAETTEN